MILTETPVTKRAFAFFDGSKSVLGYELHAKDGKRQGFISLYKRDCPEYIQIDAWVSAIRPQKPKGALRRRVIDHPILGK
jgi:hypothetical protein